MGVERTKWVYFSENVLFGKFQESNHYLHIAFGIFGFGLLVGIYVVIYQLIRQIIYVIFSSKKYEGIVISPTLVTLKSRVFG